MTLLLAAGTNSASLPSEASLIGRLDIYAFLWAGVFTVAWDAVDPIYVDNNLRRWQQQNRTVAS